MYTYEQMSICPNCHQKMGYCEDTFSGFYVNLQNNTIVANIEFSCDNCNFLTTYEIYGDITNIIET